MRSHKSNLLNSCLHSEIILWLFLTMWRCQLFFYFFFYPLHFFFFFLLFQGVHILTNNPMVSSPSLVWKCTLGRKVPQWDAVLNILQSGVESPPPATAPFAGTSNDGRLPHLSQQEHIYISSPRGILEDEVSSNWIWISLTKVNSHFCSCWGA